MLKKLFAFGFILAAAVVAASWSTRHADFTGIAAAAQGSPMPTVSVTTLPAMPGVGTPPSSLPPAMPQPMQSVMPAAVSPWTLPMPPQLGVSYIQVVGDVYHPLTLTLKDLERMRPASLTLRFHTYTGVPLTDVLNRAGLRFGNSDPQVLMRKYVYVQGLDNKSAIVSFPEFTKDFNGQLILLAYLVDLRPLPSPGFIKLVVQDDQTTTRYVTVARLIVGEPLQ